MVSLRSVFSMIENWLVHGKNYKILIKSEHCGSSVLKSTEYTNFRHFRHFVILGISLPSGLVRNVDPSAFALDFSGFIQPEYNVSNFFFVKTGFSLDLCKINSLRRAPDGIQHNIDSRQRSFAAGGLGFGMAGLHRAFNQILQTIQSDYQLIDVFFGRNIIVLHKKFDHGIETDRLALPSRHGVLLCKRVTI